MSRINIVYRTDDADNGRAAVGAIYFLTRPHPAAGDLSLLVSLVARATQAFDCADLADASLAAALVEHNARRYRLYRRVISLLARPMSASRLDLESLEAFAANMLVPVLQTIGRGIRKQVSVQVYFVDAAWAPHSAEGRPEDDRSSLLVVMRRVLQRCLTHPDSAARAVYAELYGAFGAAFDEIGGLIPPDGKPVAADDLLAPGVMTDAADLDDYDPEVDVANTGDFGAPTGASHGWNDEEQASVLSVRRLYADYEEVN